jgi:hypothetical protein
VSLDAGRITRRNRLPARIARRRAISGKDAACKDEPFQALSPNAWQVQDDQEHFSIFDSLSAPALFPVPLSSLGVCAIAGGFAASR